MSNKFVVSTLFVAAMSAGLAHAYDAPIRMNFSQTKDMLKRHVEKSGDLDYYCGCPIKVNGKQLTLDLAACGYEVRKNESRAARVEFEHIVPISWIGQQRQCWRDGGRSNCTANDEEFGKIEGDPINLIPVVGEVNADRGNLRYGMLSQNEGVGYGQCGSRVDFKAKTFMPRKDAQGDIARVNFYYQQTYNYSISRQQLQLFAAWDKLDPVDARECNRNKAIHSRTGIHNPFVTSKCNY